MRDQIDRIDPRGDFGAAGEHQDVLAMYKMFAYDEGWIRRNQRGDRQRPHRRGGDRARSAAHRIGCARSRSAAADRNARFEDLSNRLLRIVSGQSALPRSSALRQDSI